MIARKHSPTRAAELAKSVFGESLSVAAYEKLTAASLEFGDTKVAAQFVRGAMAELDDDVAVAYPHGLILNHLVTHEKVELATEFAQHLIGRIQRYETASKAGEEPSVTKGQWSHSTYAHLAKQVVKFDKKLALRLVELHQGNDNREYDDWILIKSVKVQCGTISDLEHQDLVTSSFADDLIEAYIESGQLELARKTVKDAVVVARRTTISSGAIAGKGLTVLGNNAHDRIVLARQAARFEDFELARNLMDEMTSNYERREGYRAVTKRIAELHGEEKAKTWIENTTHPISKSGAILGLGETLFPVPKDENAIPNPIVKTGC